MTVRFTEFQRPDPDTEYEEIEPIILKPDDTTVIVDKDEPPIKPKTVVCCTCKGGVITLCAAEKTSGAYTTEYGGGMLAFAIG